MEEETKKPEREETEAEISQAMRARVKDFKEQADSLTLEGVRRALEKDLGMETFSLDVHKRFIKQCLDEFFYGGGDDNLSTTKGIESDKPSSPLNKEASGGKDEPQESKDLKSSTSNINEAGEESPAEELLPNLKQTEEFVHDSKLVEDIKKAIIKQGPYFRANLKKITFGKVRRLLEQDLNLEKNTLDAYKSFISDVLDEILQSSEISEATNGIKKKSKKASQLKVTGKVKKKTMTATEDSESSNLDNDMSEADEDTVVVKSSKKRPPQKGKLSRPIKKQKTSSDENRPSGSRKKKREVLAVERESESDDEKSSEDSRAPSSSDEKSKKKHEKPTGQAYGKHVERLKSVIKSCGMGVSPAVYKRAKQVPESKREAFLIKELEDILAKEGLSSNPSDKEIKAVKRKKERARELEGIDMSNIVSSSRRRSTFSFIPVPKQKVEAGSDEDEEAEVEEDEVEEDDVEEDDEPEDTDDGDNGSGEPTEGSEEDADADADEDSD